ncbi:MULTISPECIES: lycopene cyclase domain-containing protein [unclassified Chryseobacterium]|uniref:lycopene cyclase domain-containing protein n=1 Tax=unclassified Chryseobacterium TaxID=2593645 RepID=UPI000D3A934D|nr:MULTISPECIES: lycopene cyclase domain-containing protein [unclassified Chryseobacterium]PTT73700.1 lycopene cyclase domain-containing protein [Chryseobacterium sp. HMWF001]PVV58297.1 lycopene cyclase domain-containing protein [Chryseobacterium sp. HMWF035]
MLQYTYLLINFFTVIVCFIFSFHHKIKFNRHFKAFILASSIVALFFIVWDIWFTKIGVWWFNDKYLLGLRIVNLPIEEILFFICIPFSCIFTYFCLDKFFRLDWKPEMEKIFVIFSILTLIILALYCNNRIYPFMTFLTTAISLFILYFILNARWIGKASFIYLILMPGFLGVNGILTGTGLDSPIVNYNPEHFLGIRILTIPIEDTVYGYEMILWNIFLFLKFKKKEQPIEETA